MKDIKLLQTVLKKEYLFLLMSIGLGVIGQVFFKTGALKLKDAKPFYQLLLQPHLLLGLSFYFASSLLYILSLRKIPLSIAYPSIALSYVIVVISSYFLYAEPFSLNKSLGIFSIMAGVVLLWL